MTKEEIRLAESRTRKKHWKRWGPYLSERAWGTVREDYSPQFLTRTQAVCRVLHRSLDVDLQLLPQFKELGSCVRRVGIFQNAGSIAISAPIL
jgi:hypothetical protein